MEYGKILAEYKRQHDAERVAWTNWDKAFKDIPYKRRPEYAGPTVNYDQLADWLIEMMQMECGLTETQAHYIYDKAYRDAHSAGLADVFLVADELVDFIKNYPKE
jgi:hypothetical protein